MKTKINYSQKFDFLDKIQYFLSISIPILFTIGLIPTLFDNVFPTLVTIIIIQILISLLRFRLLNITIELILIGLSVLSLIPLLGYLFRFTGIILAILDLATFKSIVIYSKFENTAFKNTKKNPKPKKEFKKSKFNNSNVKDADFKEK